MLWFKLADRLGMSLQRCMQETTSTEFVEWQIYMEMDMGVPSRADYYAAQTAAVVAQAFSSKPKRIKLEDYLLKFTKAKDPAKKPTKAEIERRTAMSKAYWGVVLSAKPHPVPPQNKKG